MVLKGITRRWMKNSLGLILLVILAIEILFAFAVRSYYYNSIRQGLDSRAAVVSNYFDKFSNTDTPDFFTRAKNLVESYSDVNKLELCILDQHGQMLISSSGFMTGGKTVPQDFKNALTSSNDTGGWIGKNPDTGEKIMAVSTLIFDTNHKRIGAVRYVVSLANVDMQVLAIILLCLLIGISIVFFVVLSSAYFVNSIVMPVSEIGATARRIASGDFNARIDKKYDDEIGDLCDTINYMATELNATENIKNEFLSSVSHELRTPLTAIKGWAETLSDCGPQDQDTLNKGIKVIVSETERLSSMVEELLDFSRIQGGKFQMIMDKTDLLAELGEAVLMFSERAKREKIILQYQEPESLPPVICDHNRIMQVFVNILDNAIKYSDRGDVVTVRAFAEENNIQVIISDTGCGIPASDLPKVKEKFFKSNSTRRGSGIGLAVADEIIKMHDGILDVVSEEGVGTTVTIALPIIRSQNKL